MDVLAWPPKYPYAGLTVISSSDVVRRDSSVRCHLVSPDATFHDLLKRLLKPVKMADDIAFRSVSLEESLSRTRIDVRDVLPARRPLEARRVHEFRKRLRGCCDGTPRSSDASLQPIGPTINARHWRGKRCRLRVGVALDLPDTFALRVRSAMRRDGQKSDITP